MRPQKNTTQTTILTSTYHQMKPSGPNR